MLEVVYHSHQKRFPLLGIEWGWGAYYVYFMRRMWGFRWRTRCRFGRHTWTRQYSNASAITHFLCLDCGDIREVDNE